MAMDSDRQLGIVAAWATMSYTQALAEMTKAELFGEAEKKSFYLGQITVFEVLATLLESMHKEEGQGMLADTIESEGMEDPFKSEDSFQAMSVESLFDSLDGILADKGNDVNE